MSVSRCAVVMDAVDVCMSCSLLACWITCVSSGMIRFLRSMISCHSPRSTGESDLTIHLRYIHIRLHAEEELRGMIPRLPCAAKCVHIASMALRAVMPLVPPRAGLPLLFSAMKAAMEPICLQRVSV